jgi:tellurite resistance protein TehA-like permease
MFFQGRVMELISTKLALYALAQAGAGEESSATLAMEKAAQADPALFQPLIFWAYGLACLLIFFFTFWTFRQARGIEQRMVHLEERFRRVHPQA